MDLSDCTRCDLTAYIWQSWWSALTHEQWERAAQLRADLLTLVGRIPDDADTDALYDEMHEAQDRNDWCRSVDVGTIFGVVLKSVRSSTPKVPLTPGGGVVLMRGVMSPRAATAHRTRAR